MLQLKSSGCTDPIPTASKTELEGSLKRTQTQPCHVQGCPPPAQAAQGPIQPGWKKSNSADLHKQELSLLSSGFKRSTEGYIHTLTTGFLQLHQNFQKGKEHRSPVRAWWDRHWQCIANCSGNIRASEKIFCLSLSCTISALLGKAYIYNNNWRN